MRRRYLVRPYNAPVGAAAAAAGTAYAGEVGAEVKLAKGSPAPV